MRTSLPEWLTGLTTLYGGLASKRASSHEDKRRLRSNEEGMGSFRSNGSGSIVAPLRSEEINEVIDQSEVSLGLHAIARLFCDVVLHVSADLAVAHAYGTLDEFFQAKVEGQNLKDVVAVADRAQLDATLSKSHLQAPQVLPVTLLRDGGIGVMTAKLLIMSTNCSEQRFIIGVRTEDVDRFYARSDSSSASYQSETSDPVPLPSVSSVPRMGNRNRRTSNHSDMSWASQASYGGQERRLRHSGKSEMSSGLQSEVSFNVSTAESLVYSTTSSGNMSQLSSFVTAGAARTWMSRSRKGTLSSFASSKRSSAQPSRFNSRLLSVSARVQTEDSASQTDAPAEASGGRGEVGTQTEAAHVPLPKSALRGIRPPLDPSALARRTSVSSNGKRIGKPITGVGSRRPSRSSSDGGISAVSVMSSDSEDLVIRHFSVTPADTIMCALDMISDHVNVHMGFHTCCTWHATLVAIGAALSTLKTKPCKKQDWLPSSGWQCMECSALNDVTEDDCFICWSDRCSPAARPPPTRHSRSSQDSGEDSGRTGSPRESPRESPRSPTESPPSEAPVQSSPSAAAAQEATPLPGELVKAV